MNDDRQQVSSHSWSMRLGGAAIGLMAGLFLGFLVALLRLALGWPAGVPFASWVFGIAAIAAVLCAVVPSVALVLFPGLGQVIAGMASGAVAAETAHVAHQPEFHLPSWLKWLFYVGFLAGLLLWGLVRWW